MFYTSDIGGQGYYILFAARTQDKIPAVAGKKEKDFFSFRRRPCGRVGTGDRGMKILHTSDWHIGKKLMNRERLDEQAAVLDEIADVCEREGVELLLVAGDVYDTFLPPAEAEELFFRAIRKLTGKDRAALIISGNHDDPVRLSACAPLAQEAGIYVVGPRTSPLPVGGGRAVHVASSGEGYAVFENGKGERVYVNILPYPNEARLREEKTDEGYGEKISRWIARGQAAYAGDMPCILLSHLFVAGGVSSEGERDIDLGGARAVELARLPDCDYIALGHLHKKQHFKEKNVWYSGSILQYSFDEAGTQKRVLLLETDEKKVRSVREIPLTQGKNLRRLSADGVAEGLRLLEEEPDCHAELTLRLAAPLTGEETAALLSHKCLKSLIPVVAGGTGGDFCVRRRELTDAELFDEYYRSLYGRDAAGELKTLFLSILGEVSP